MANAAGEIVYVEMISPQADADLGKLPKGKILAMPSDRAARFISAGVARESSEAALNAQRDERFDTVADRTTRAGEFDALNQQGAALWDSATHRDVLTAPEDGIREAIDNGIPLVNTVYLKQENGAPLDPKASADEVIEARKRLSFGQEAATTVHERSSVMGGGYHTDPLPVNQEFSTLGGVAPLNKPIHELSPEQLGNVQSNRRKAADDDADDADPPSRSAARVRTPKAAAPTVVPKTTPGELPKDGDKTEEKKGD